LKIDSRAVADIHILDCYGKVTLGEGSIAIRIAVREVLRDGGRKILLNFEAVRKMDTASVGQIFKSAVDVKNRGGQLKLACVSGIDDLNVVNQLCMSCDVHTTLNKAMASF
jgi:anti-sigma B factor antagonist